MNDFTKNNKRFFSLVLGILLHGSLHAMTVYGKHLSDIVPQGQPLSITFLEKDDTVILKMRKGFFDAKSGRDGIANLESSFKGVVANGSHFSYTGTLNISCDKLDLNWSHLVAQDRMNITAKTSLELKKCLLQSPFISMVCNQMNFKDCFFVKPQILNIIGDCQDSDYNNIQVIFRDQSTIPTVMFGEIDLKDSEAIQQLVFTNVKEIRVLFNPQAWKKENKEIEKILEQHPFLAVFLLYLLMNSR